MTKLRSSHRQSFRIGGQTYLWLAILIFGVSSAVTRKITEIGAQNFIGGSNPISLCNVLFVGNLCALIILTTIYWRNWNKATLKQLSFKNWFNLTIVAILSGALAPGLIFQALALTEVNNVILVGRLEPPLTLALSVWLLKERVNLWQVLGAIASFIGVMLTITLQPPTNAMMMNAGGFHIGVGELLAAVGSVALSISIIITKKHLLQIPAGIYSIFRTALGTVIFFFLALVLYGSDHFMNAFSPFLWRWMLLYAAIIIVVGQSFWIRGLKACTVSMASLASSFIPIIGILAAYLILGEVPTQAQYLGGSVILFGIFLSQVGISRQSSTQEKQTIENKIGFKGV
ncbi:DMT family transporter [Scytonema hofmannii FACHB-248]|uniref:DMT family transporter n=1 Tax=Scytonema hofmannii FACHB-248 TaxID=1842502 RepID=A0ABR8GJZ2_9CYAN|nr:MULTISPECIES: DMT family transporter [Nostocales]MBD2603648.1 DMT family transporter [Scytonema hofmannii FACHB-248]